MTPPLADAGARLALDYVSPLPPVRSGIADYSADLLPALAARCDLRLAVPSALPVAEAILAQWPHTLAGQTGSGGRLPLYQMGNNFYHEEVYRLAMERPGVLTLHDLVLHHFLLDRSFHGGDIDLYRRQLTADHGWVGEVVAASVRWGVLNDATQFSLPVRRSLLRRQRGVLVHSAWAVTELTGEDPDIRVRAVPMGVPLPATAEAAAGRRLRERFGIPLDCPLLGSLGFQTPIKRTGQVIAALASPGLTSAHLLVAGEVSPSLELEADARKAGLAERVHVTGFLDFADYQAAIAACDLCLNLRYPSAGETSASLLRILAAGRPAVVSEFAQFAELPAGVAVKIPVGEGEVEALEVELARLLADRSRLAAMGAAAREHVRRHHDPDRAAEAILGACAEWAAAEVPADRAPATLTPTSLVWSHLPGSLTVAGVEAPWRVGERRRLGVRLDNRGFARWLATERGPGGVVVRLEFRDRDDRPVAEGAWAPLLPDLDPGGSELVEVELRRPPRAARLIVEPHVIGRCGFNALGGPVWTRAL